jgi:hypothetical protein
MEMDFCVVFCGVDISQLSDINTEDLFLYISFGRRVSTQFLVFSIPTRVNITVYNTEMFSIC